MTKTPWCLATFLLACLTLCDIAAAQDTTPPTLTIRQTWIEKSGTTYHFKMLLDPQDNVGVNKIQFRTALNTTAALPDSAPWYDYDWNPSMKGMVFDEGFICTAIVIEVRATDLAGKASVLQRRTFQAPFPITTAPNLEPKFNPIQLTFPTTGSPAMDCKGLFVADLEGNGYEDILEVDNSNGKVTVRPQQFGATATTAFSAATVVLNLTPGSIQDSAIGDFDGDGLPDLIIVANHDVLVYHNNSTYDFINGSVFSFIPVDLDRSASGIDSVDNVAVADMDGDGAMDAVIVGTGPDADSNPVAKIEVLVNSNNGLSAAVNTSLAPVNGGTGRMAVADLTGDGVLDVAMIDNKNHQAVIFKGLGDGSLGGADAASSGDQPKKVHLRNDCTAQGIAIGDIAGRGHNDIVVAEYYYGQLNAPYADGKNHRAQLWHYLPYDDLNGFVATTLVLAAAGPADEPNTFFPGDVMIRDYTGDRFPEIVMTNEFNSGVYLARFTEPLDNQNRLAGTTFDPVTPTTVSTASQHPQRLAAGRYQSASITKEDLVVASGGSNEVTWLFNNYTPSNKTYDLVGGASTSNDPDGSLDVNGALKYTAFTNDTVSYSLTYVNNSPTDIPAGATINCVLPASLTFAFGGSDCVSKKVGLTTSLTWTFTSAIPHNSAGVKNIIARVNTTVSGTIIAPTATFKKGTTAIATCTMPKVTVLEATGLTLKASSTSDPLGETAHKDETITYTMRLTNSSLNTLATVSIGTAFPVGTKYVAGSVGGIVTNGASVLTPKIRGTTGKETGCDWTLTNMPPNGVKEITFQVTVTGAENTSITENTAVAAHQTSKITATPFITKILPPLGILISADKSTARPGDIIQYYVTVHNYSSTAAANVVFADMVPAGMRLVNFYHQQGASLDFTSGSGDPLDDSYTTTTNPSYDKVNKVMGWKWAGIPSHGELGIRFDCQVLLDDPLFALGSTTTANNVSNSSYNAVGTFGTTKSFSAVPAAGVVVAGKATATTAQLLATSVAPIKSSLTGANPLPLPKLSLKKFVADPDGLLQVGSDLRFSVINDAAVSNDGFFHYALDVHNGSGAGTATGVVVHEFIPTGATFQGFIARDGVNVPSYFGFHFYNAAGVEIPTVTATTTPLVKSFTIPVGDVPAGADVVYTYKVSTTLAAGGLVVSNSAAVTGKSGLYTFDPPTGYCLTATNMNFPTVGSPKQLTVNIIAPAAFNFPAGILHTATKVKTVADSSAIAIPLEVIGAEGLDLSDIKMVVTLPKGYLVKPALVLVDGSGTAISGSTNVRTASTGITTLTFPIGNNRHATASFEVYLDSANLKSVEDASGRIKAPLSIKPTLTGSYGRSATATALALGAHVQTTTPAPKPIAAAATVGAQEFVLSNNSAIFIGRYAPATVRRGSTLTYTIFLGNLSEVPTDGALVTMNVPAGTTYVSSTAYCYDAYSGTASDHNISNAGIAGVLKATLSATGKVTWLAGILGPGEGGVVSLTVKVPDTYAGGRIDDNTCAVQLTNGNGKTPGPLGVVVLAGNDPSQSAAATQSAFEGTGGTYSDDVRAAVELKGFSVNSSSYNVTTGGCDAMHLQNDVVLIPLKSTANLYNRVMLVGPKAVVTGNTKNILMDAGNMRVVVGPGEPETAETAVDIKSFLSGYSGATALASPNSLLSALNGGALVAAGGGNLVAAGGGNLVAAGGGNLVAAGGGNLVAAGGGNFASISPALILLPASDFMTSDAVGGHLVAAGGGNLVAAGGGNLVAAGGGNLVAAGGGNIISHDGGGLIGQDGAGLIGKTVDNLISQDGAGLQMTGTNNLFSSSTGNLVNGTLVNQ